MTNTMPMRTLDPFSCELPEIIFEPETKHFNNSVAGPYYNSTLINDGYKHHYKSIDIISSNKKAMLMLPEGFFHYFADIAAFIIFLNEQEPECEIIIDETEITKYIHLKKPNYYSFIYNMMDNLGIKYRILRDTDESIININNFTVANDFRFNHYSNVSNKILAYIEKHIINDFSEPFRKVYLSRSSAISRIDNEDVLVDFFMSKDFEIVDVNSFPTIEDQIRFFYQAKIICGLTGSGLTNMLFTRDGQIAIELVTLLGVPSRPDPDIILWYMHNFYRMISFAKKQTLVNIQNYSKNPEILVELISKHLKVLGEL